jgi:ATP-dependent Clp protease ATP-binding subunit ClpC
VEAVVEGEALQRIGQTLRRRVIGQDRSVAPFVRGLSRMLSGLRDPERPVMSALLLGPTGVGKTETARALAHALFGSEKALTRINCEGYSSAHEISKLFGSPPGYVGHEIEPLLSQSRLDQHHIDALSNRSGLVGEGVGRLCELYSAEQQRALSIVLFDEIEKADPALWNALLGILEGGTLTLGNNKTVDFTRSIILMTSNAGSREAAELCESRRVGFTALATQAEEVVDAVQSVTQATFPLEFLNRLDETLIYSPLDREHLLAIFDKILCEIHVRAMKCAGVPLLIQVKDDAKQWIVDRGTSALFGARPLRREMEAELVDPLSCMIASGTLGAGDVVEVGLEGEELGFHRLRAPATGADGSAAEARSLEYGA